MVLRTRGQTFTAPSLVIEAAERYRQTAQVLYLGGIIHENADLWPEIERRICFMWACFKQFRPGLYDRKPTPISLKVRMLKTEVIRNPMCDVDVRCGTLNGAPPSSSTGRWLSPPTTSRLRHPLVREGAQEDTIREHRKGHP